MKNTKSSPNPSSHSTPIIGCHTMGKVLMTLLLLMFVPFQSHGQRIREFNFSGYEVDTTLDTFQSAMGDDGEDYLDELNSFSEILYWEVDSNMNPDITLVYKNPVVNTPGPDLVTFMYSPRFNWSGNFIFPYGKTMNYVINGVAKEITTNLGVPSGNNNSFQYRHAAFVELSDFGVAEGESISSVKILASAFSTSANFNAWYQGRKGLSAKYGNYSDVYTYGVWPIIKCGISGITADNVSTCNDNGTPDNLGDDFFTADITVSFINAPDNGQLILDGGASESVTVGALDSATSHTFSNVRLPADGDAISFTASFSGDSNCRFTNVSVLIAPGPCSIINCEDAGTDGSLIICEGETVTEQQLFDALNGDPDTGGVWSPVLAGAGTYTYTIAASGSCPEATAQVTVTEEKAPYPGGDGSLTICEGEIVTEQQLFDALNGNPDTGGVWSPELAGAGTYTYTIPASGSCPEATAQVTVTEDPAPNAGTDGSLTICEGETVTEAQLFAALNGDPDTGGVFLKKGIPPR
ncbi:MAG: hypothetical protein AAGA86_14210 [Bacteroidota bacterium]